MKMNCIELRRRLLEDPAERSVEIQAHLDRCEGCREFANRSKAMEKDLVEALALEVPENLTSRILLRQSTSVEKQVEIAGNGGVRLLPAYY